MKGRCKTEKSLAKFCFKDKKEMYYELLKPLMLNATNNWATWSVHWKEKDKNMSRDKVIFQHDNVRSHVATIGMNTLEAIDWDVLSQNKNKCPIVYEISKCDCNIVLSKVRTTHSYKLFVSIVLVIISNLFVNRIYFHVCTYFNYLNVIFQRTK